MNYTNILSKPFPHVVNVSKEVALEAASFLIKDKDGLERAIGAFTSFVQGPLFAVTSDPMRKDYRRLWLSERSYDRLKYAELI